MTQEEKELLLKDLCGRLPYEVKVEYRGKLITLDYALFAKEYSLAFGQYPMKFNLDKLDTIKPYLRPMSSMTEEEKKELFQLMGCGNEVGKIDFYNSYHLDYRGLIPMGLALEASEGMYNT